MSQSQPGFFVLDDRIENVSNLAALCQEAAMDLSGFRAVHHSFHFLARDNMQVLPCMKVVEFCDIMKELINTRKVKHVIFTGEKTGNGGNSSTNGVVFTMLADGFPLDIQKLLMPIEENAKKILAVDLTFHPNWPFFEDAVLSSDYIVSGDTLVFLLCRGGGDAKRLLSKDCDGIPTSAYRVFSEGGAYYPLFDELIITGYADHTMKRPITSMVLPWNTQWTPKYIVDQKDGTVFRVITEHPEVLDEDDVKQKGKLDCVRVGWIPFAREVSTNTVVTCELTGFSVNRKNTVKVENLRIGEKSK